MVSLVKETVKLFIKGEYRWIPSSLAFHFFLSFIPIIFLTIILSVKQIITDDFILKMLHENENMSVLLDDFLVYVEQDFANVSLTTLVLLIGYSLYLSSNGIVGVMHAVSSFYGFKRVNFLIVKVVAFFTNLLLLFAFIALSVISSFLPRVLLIFRIDLGINIFLAYISVLPVIYIVVHFIYILVSLGKLRSKDIYKGAVFTTIAIYVVLIFTTYFMQLGRVSVIYGSLASIVFIAYFIYYMCYVIYLGIAINVAEYRIKHEEVLEYDIKD